MLSLLWFLVEVVQMVSDQYRKTIEVAEKELNEVAEQIDVLSQRRAQLQQTISALRKLCGEETDDLTITENIRIILQGSTVALSATEVLRGLEAAGVVFTGKNPIASVQTMLARMARPDGEIEKVSGSQGTVAYAWNRRRPIRLG